MWTGGRQKVSSAGCAAPKTPQPRGSAAALIFGRRRWPYSLQATGAPAPRGCARTAFAGAGKYGEHARGDVSNVVRFI